MRDPLVIPMAAVGAGVLLCRWIPFSVHEIAWPAGAFVVLWIVVAWRGRQALKHICAVLTMLCAGVLSAAWQHRASAPELDAGPREVVRLAGCVVEPTALSPQREQFTLELAAGARARVTQTLKDDQTPQPLHYGQRVEIEGRVRPPHNYRNPGAFDYAAYLARQKIYWTASMTRGSEAKMLPGRCGNRAWSLIYGLRETAIARLDRLYAADDYATGMMEAVLIGETSKLEKIWTENFRRTGTYHALVISGAHVVVLAGVLMFFLRLCALAELPSLALTAVAAWLYALVTGFSPPVGRAAGGFTLYLIARFLFRRGRVINLLAAVVIVYLLADPDEIFDASFQLSFLSVAAIGALAAPILEATSGPYLKGLRGIDQLDADPHLPPGVAQARVEIRLIAETLELWLRVPARWAARAMAGAARLFLFAWELILISAVIQIGLALPMAEDFHRVSFTGLSANLIIVPLLSAVVPLGFAAIFTGWHWIAALAGWLLSIAAKVADWHAHIEPSWRIADPPLWLAAAFVVSLIALAMLIQRKIGRWIAGAAVLGCFALLLWQPWPVDVGRGKLELTAIDVGQGDSLLVVFPDGKTMVVDAGGILTFGPQRRRPNLDTGEDVVSPYLWSRGIRRIDVLVVTHAHEDHVGGAAALLENFHPGRIWVGANPSEAFLATAARLHIPVDAMHASGEFSFGGTKIEPLSPPVDYVARRIGNNDSLAFRIQYGSRTFLFTGDMERPMENRLLENPLALQADVLKVGHHGSKTSSTEAFLEAVSPSVAVISAGYENSFGHPHPDVLARLSERHSAILRTDLDGLVTVLTDGEHLWFDQAAWETAGHAGNFDWALSLDR